MELGQRSCKARAKVVREVVCVDGGREAGGG